MTQGHQINDDRSQRIASLLAQVLLELQQPAVHESTLDDGRRELKAARDALEETTRRLEDQLSEEKQQRSLLASQLTGLATSLDRLVSHLQGLSTLMVDLLESMVTEPRSSAPVSSEPAFQPGGEGLSLILSAVPGFQALMEIQKALMALNQVSGVSVERFQEGDSRLLIHLTSSITPAALIDALGTATGYAIATEESLPELSRLRLKIVPSS